MVANREYDLSRPLASALKAKAPYVGIPLPGHAPLIFKRKFLQAALRGVKPVNIEVETYDSGVRALIVDGVASYSCRTHIKAISIHRNRLLAWHTPEAKEMDKWRPTVSNKTVAPRQGKHAKAIAKLQKQFDRLGDRPKIENPAVPAVYREATEWRREAWSQWKAEKLLRGKVGALAKRARTGTIDSRTFYAELGKLTKIKRFSDITAYERRRSSVEYFMDYVNPKFLWERLPELSKGMGCRNQDCYEEHQQSDYWGPKRYQCVLEWSRERAEILSQIEAVKNMMPVAA